ncbi:hypothetical protein [Duganella violaceipulchra]|uniref:Uncharacterized protein n=1 Tax=Duganella violaceipulchra TaxID=2849652 RepID=A0AA41HFI5_9BURK|nr:hypothetical protein [Duganella violaceicalia]MBV6322793.1 hypothetical protein [Duganella violaceicalia]MCP2007873.1 hypothetical protein [Duganella violaceicalia]
MKIDTRALGDASVAAFTPRKKSDGGAEFKAALEAAKQPTAAQELDTYMKKSPAQRMQEMILKSLGLTPEGLAAKSPEEQASIMAKVGEILRQKMEEAAAKASGGGQAAGGGSPAV